MAGTPLSVYNTFIGTENRTGLRMLGFMVYCDATFSVQSSGWGRQTLAWQVQGVRVRVNRDASLCEKEIEGESEKERERENERERKRKRTKERDSESVKERERERERENRDASLGDAEEVVSNSLSPSDTLDGGGRHQRV